jgi:hypothetical protein
VYGTGALRTPLILTKLATRGWSAALRRHVLIPSSSPSLDVSYSVHRDLDVFYGGVPNDAIPLGPIQVLENTSDPMNERLGIHHWARHGICGRGVFLDVANFSDEICLPSFDPFGGFAITVDQLKTVAALEGVEFRHADILVVRYGSTKVRGLDLLPGCFKYLIFTQRYMDGSPSERIAWGSSQSIKFFSENKSLTV